MSKLNKAIFYPSSLVLILANMIPLLGVLFFSWDIFTIIILYWMESAVIGFFNVLKMQKINNYKFTSIIPFFIVHYSMFMFAHLFFIINFFQPELGSSSEQVKAFGIVFKYLEGLFISLAFLFLSHGVSFMFNFIKKREFQHIKIREQMSAPYKRIIIMHIVIIFTGQGVVYAGYSGAISAIVFLVILKIFFDLSSHIFEHRKNILN